VPKFRQIKPSLEKNREKKDQIPAKENETIIKK